MNTFYFETSSVNYVNENYSTLEVELIREFFITSYQAIPVISPITIWEILNTSDSIKKEELLLTCQILFNGKLLASPIEYINSFIKKGCPIEEKDRNVLYSDSSLSAVWEELTTNLSKTIVVDNQILQDRKQDVYMQSKILVDLISKEFSCSISENPNIEEGICYLIEYVYSRVKFINEYNAINKNDELLYKTSIYFMIMVLIMGVEFHPEKLSLFWKNKKAESIIEQLDYLIKNHEIVLHRGPLIEMSTMAIDQFKNGHNRGLYIDCLHALYISYSNAFFTIDNHFISMKNFKPKELFDKINDFRAIDWPDFPMLPDFKSPYKKTNQI